MGPSPSPPHRSQTRLSKRFPGRAARAGLCPGSSRRPRCRPPVAPARLRSAPRPAGGALAWRGRAERGHGPAPAPPQAGAGKGSEGMGRGSEGQAGVPSPPPGSRPAVAARGAEPELRGARRFCGGEQPRVKAAGEPAGLGGAVTGSLQPAWETRGPHAPCASLGCRRVGCRWCFGLRERNAAHGVIWGRTEALKKR